LKLQATHPLLSRSNILKATEKLDSGMLSRVTKKMYLNVEHGKD
jgi:CMP-N-acetylneuraminic acid synthetase